MGMSEQRPEYCIVGAGIYPFLTLLTIGLAVALGCQRNAPYVIRGNFQLAESPVDRVFEGYSTLLFTSQDGKVYVVISPEVDDSVLQRSHNKMQAGMTYALELREVDSTPEMVVHIRGNNVSYVLDYTIPGMKTDTGVTIWSDGGLAVKLYTSPDIIGRYLLER